MASLVGIYRNFLTILPKEKGGDAAKLMAGFLTHDIQEGVNIALEVIEKVNEVKSGKCDQWEIVGNSFSLTLYPDHAILEDLFPVDNKAPVKAVIALSDVEDSVNELIKFLR